MLFVEHNISDPRKSVYPCLVGEILGGLVNQTDCISERSRI